MQKMNKAIVAVIGGAIVIVNTIWNVDVGIDPGTINAVASLATAALVYLVPNKA